MAKLLPLLLLINTALMAQGPGVPVFPEGRGVKKPLGYTKQCKSLVAESKLLSHDQVVEQMKRTSCQLELPAPSTTVLDSRSLWSRARAAHVRVGWHYLCHTCDRWHTEVAGGYAITTSCVVTCAHVAQPLPDMKEGWLIAVDEDDKVIPVAEVLAARGESDTAVLRLDTQALKPLPLSSDLFPGDSVVCYSDPMRYRGHYSEGTVSRFVKRRSMRGSELTDEQKADLSSVHAPVWLATDLEWAPGSSGSAVLDSCGNAVGTVSTIQTLLEDTEEPKGKRQKETPPPGTLLVVHEAIVAAEVRALIR
jgi:hypothetical protein